MVLWPTHVAVITSSLNRVAASYKHRGRTTTLEYRGHLTCSKKSWWDTIGIPWN